MNAEDMTLETAIAELRTMATLFEAGPPSGPGYAARLNVIADFLVGFGEALTEGMSNLTDEVKHLRSEMERI